MSWANDSGVGIVMRICIRRVVLTLALALLCIADITVNIVFRIFTNMAIQVIAVIMITFCS